MINANEIDTTWSTV